MRKELRNIWLILASVFFYAWGEKKYTIVLLFSIVLNYYLGLLIDKSELKTKRKLYLALGLLLNFGMLFYFKYYNFIVSNITNILSISDLNNRSIHLPIGISFFTFQATTYLVDIYFNKAPVLKKITHLALYKSFFPQLIAGPIVKFHDINDQLAERIVHLEDFVYGVKRFIIGLAKKVLIANQVAQVADKIFSLNDGNLPMSLAWIGIIAYTLQIYFDFSGYSDMAIGLARMFGFKFPENFDYPYVSKSIQEFWRRWHISLSTWFKEYLYIPLGGSRVSKNRLYLNILIVFGLTGLWHGASWNFVIWGLFNGLILILERSFLGQILQKFPLYLRHAYTLLVIMIGWVFFRSDNLSQAFLYLGSMANFKFDLNSQYNIFNLINNEALTALICGLFFSTPITKILINRISALTKDSNQLFHQSAKAINNAIILCLFMISAAYLLISTYNPFIYFRF